MISPDATIARWPRPRTAVRVALRKCFSDPLLEVMNILNEVAIEYPDAISFGAGRPPEDLFEVRRTVAAASDYLRSSSGSDADEAWNELGKYNKTNGIIKEAIATHLALDEGIEVCPDDLIVTVGAQEAMAIVLLGLVEPETDVLLVSDPTYIGITGLARLLGIKVWPVPSGEAGLDADV